MAGKTAMLPPARNVSGAQAPHVGESMKSLLARLGVGFGGACGSDAGSRHPAPWLKKLSPFMLLLGLALLSGCGGGATSSVRAINSTSTNGSSGNGTSGNNGTGSTLTTAVLLNLGEFASVPNQIVSFEVTIESVALRLSNGGGVVLGISRRVDLSRLKGEPLLLSGVPQGKYSGVAICLSKPQISFIDSDGILHEEVVASLVPSSPSIVSEFGFDSAPGEVLHCASNASEFGFDSTPGGINLNLFVSVSYDDSSAVTVTPLLNFSTGGQPTKDLIGRVTAVGRGTLTIDVGGATFTLGIDGSTEFLGVTSLSGLSAGMTVEVDAVFGSGGIFRATKVKLENDNASAVVVEGLALSLTPGELQVMVREVHGPGDVEVPARGKSLTVNTTASTQFRLEPVAFDLNNLDFAPTFDALTILKGQNVRAAAASGNAATITADQIKLAKQSIDGTANTVTAGSVSGQYSFPLTLAADSAFARLTGHTSLLVTVQPSAQKFLYFGQEDCVTCIAGGRVRVRGLLFFSGGEYRLVAEWLAVN